MRAVPQPCVVGPAMAAPAERPAHEEHVRGTASRLHTTARSLVKHLWHETGVLDEAVRRVAFGRNLEVDPTGPWRTATLPVDATMLPFGFLEHDDAWVALGPHGDTLVALQGARWPLAETGLVTIHDLDPYAEGFIEIQRSW